ncbi:MAG: acyltransferase [Myxococcota bacterium]|nr:acyltransferase [Myxococcota bacterium]
MRAPESYGFKAIGEGAQIFEPVVVLGAQNIVVKNRFMLSAFAYLSGGVGTYLGNFIHIATHTSITGGGWCVLEDFVGVCAGARIITGTDDVSGAGIPTPTIPKDLQGEFRAFYRSFVHCEKHSFIGTNAVITPGVTVGEGTVIGSGAVVTKDLEPWGIYVGVPARRVADRPSKKILELEARLLEQCPADREGLGEFIAEAKSRP